WTTPLAPPPSADHAVPFQLAMHDAAAPPAVVNPPPATRSLFGSTASAYTPPSMPAPSGDHALPFQRAMRLALAPPAIVNWPPTIKSPLLAVVEVHAQSLTPLPSGDHRPVAGSSAATEGIGTPPMLEKTPATTNSGGIGPLPSRSQVTAVSA